MQTKKKTARRSLAVSAVALLLSVAMLVGTTFAWFTDTVTSGTNTITAGNLDIEVSYKNETTDTWKSMEKDTSLFSSNLWEPGHTEFVTLKIENKGTLALNYKVLVTPVSEKGGVNVKGNSFKLSDYLVVKTTEPSTTDPDFPNRQAARAAAGGETGLADVNGLTRTGDMDGKTGETPVVEYVTLVVYMPEDVDNKANYKTGTEPPSIDLGIKVLATQKTEENDSFGSDYDKEAVNDSFYKVGAYYDYYPQVRASKEVAESGNTVITATGKLNINDDNVITLAKVTVPHAAVAEDATTLTVTVVPKAPAQSTTDKPGLSAEIQNSNRETANFDIKVEGIASDNNEAITVEVFVGKGLSNVKVYHNGNVISDAGYNADTGIVTFNTKTFSDYTVAYDVAAAAIGSKTYGSLQLALDAAKNGETIQMLKDITENVTVPAASKVVLDLNGHEIKYTQTKPATILNNGSLTIQDTAKTGKVVSTGGAAVGVGDNSTTTIKSGTFESVEGAVITGYATGATIDIEGGTFSASDNAVIGGNGSRRDGAPNTINISGGTFNGGIVTKGYVACGIYAPWQDIINVSGGTFNITGGAGIVARAGNVTVSGGEFHVTGSATGKVGDSRVVVPCSALVFDSEAKYPAMTNESKITVTGGNFTSDVACIRTVQDTDKGRVDVTGGTFSNDPSDYVPTGYTATKDGNVWKVGVEVQNVSSDTELAKALSNSASDVAVNLMSGSYAIPAVSNKNITIIGQGNSTVIDVSGDKAYHNSNVTIKNCAIQGASGNYQGLQHVSTLTYENCELTGLQFLYGTTTTFRDCKFESADDAYSLWTYGSKNVDFSNCEFVSGASSKSVLCYLEGSVQGTLKRTFTNCTFTAEGTPEKSAVMVNPTADKNVINTYDIVFTDCKATGYAENGIHGQTLVGVKETVKDNITITVDGEVVYLHN